MKNSSADKRTILYVSGFSDIVGGGQRSFFLLLKNLDRSRFRMVVLCPGPGEVSREVSGMGAEVVFLKIPRLRSWKIWELAVYVRKLRGIAAESGADLVHCDTLDAAFLAGLSFCGLPLVFHARVSDTGAILDHIVPFFCDRIICVSKAVADRFTGFAGRAAKLQVIYNGVDVESFRPGISGADLRSRHAIANEAPLLGYCGQLDETKGLTGLVEAFKAVSLEFPDSRLILAGRGALEPNLRLQVKSLGLANSVIFTGFIEDIPGFMAALDIFVLPSKWKEGFARVLLEAMASGKPVIATNVGGNVEAVADGETGYLCGPEDTDGLARKIIALLKDRPLAEKMGQAGRLRVVNNFSIKKTAADIHALYTSLLY